MDMLKLFFSYYGRIGRAKFLLAQLTNVLMQLMGIFLSVSLFPDRPVNTAFGVWLAVCGISSVALQVKRLHDLNLSGWWVARLGAHLHPPR